MYVLGKSSIFSIKSNLHICLKLETRSDSKSREQDNVQLGVSIRYNLSLIIVVILRKLENCYHIVAYWRYIVFMFDIYGK